MTYLGRVAGRSRAIALANLLIIAACSSGGTKQGKIATPCVAGVDPLSKVTIAANYSQPAELAGVWLAIRQGCFAEFGLDVSISQVPDPIAAVVNHTADFALSPVIPALTARELGAPIVEVAQIFQRSPTRLASFATLNLTGPAQWKSKRVGLLPGVDGIEVSATVAHAGWDVKKKEVRLVSITPDVRAMMNGDIDVAQITVFDQLGTLLTTRNPKKSTSFGVADFNLVDVNTQNSATLNQSLWADATRIKSSGYGDQATKVIAGIGQGWAVCRDDLESCSTSMSGTQSAPSVSHGRWQINEINRLLWPAAHGFGNIDDVSWQQTVKIAISQSPQGKGAPLKAAPLNGYTNEFVAKAATLLVSHHVDTVGLGYAYSTTETP